MEEESLGDEVIKPIENKQSKPEPKNSGRGKGSANSVLLLGIVSAFLTMPLFMLLYKYFPSMEIEIVGRSVRLDHILLFLTIFFASYYLLKKFRLIVYVLLIGGLVVLTITNFSGIYTMKNLYHDYAEFLYDLSGNSSNHIFPEYDGEFAKEQELRAAIDYTEPTLRNYAASIAIKHFDEQAYLSKNKKWVQFFSVFKEVYGKWNYVYDPVNEDYYSKASETVTQLDYDEKFKGDCDDYSIMIAACIRAIGGEVRLVRTVVKKDDQEIGHMYPEVKFGNSKDLETVVYLIKNVFFIEEARGNSIHYYKDSKGFIWLNFDYNDAYPGGRFQSDIRVSELII